MLWCVLTQETADEGQGGAEPPPPSSLPQASQSQGGPAQPNGPSSPRVTTVKDLMLSVIEVSLMKTQSAPSDNSAAASAPPTISSILSSESSYVSRDFRPTPEKVVTNSHHDPSHAPKDAANAHPPDLPKEGLVVLQVS